MCNNKKRGLNLKEGREEHVHTLVCVCVVALEGRKGKCIIISKNKKKLKNTNPTLFYRELMLILLIGFVRNLSPEQKQETARSLLALCSWPFVLSAKYQP